MGYKLNRRDFLKAGVLIGTTALGKSEPVPFPIQKNTSSSENIPDISVVKGNNFITGTRKAVGMLGGMKKFVPEGSNVVIMPNSQSAHPGTFTKPDIVRTVIRMCQEAGAREISCLSWLTPKHWERTGLDQVVMEEGAEMKFIERNTANFRSIPLPSGKKLKEAHIIRAFFENDVFINLPIIKDHAGNKFTGTMKNYMALNNPETNKFFHTGEFNTSDDIEHLDQCIADLNTAFAPTLCIVDATEFVSTNGPFGPGKLKSPLKIVAGTDRIAIDSYCCGLLDLKPEEIIMIRKGSEHGLGQMDLSRVSIKEVENN